MPDDLCACKHPRDFHVATGDSVPLCIECGCIGFKEVPEWIRKLRGFDDKTR